MSPQEVELFRAVRPEALGRRIQAARIARGLTQRELADGEVSVAYISRIESGQRRPDVRLLERMAERLGTTSVALVTGMSDGPAELRHLLDRALDLCERMASSLGAPASTWRMLAELLDDAGEPDRARAATTRAVTTHTP